MTRRKEPSVASFGPQLLEFLRKGAREKVEVTVKEKKPTFWRMRLHHLRSRMRAENHPDAELVQKVRISITPSSIIAQPADSEDLEGFLAAGITTPASGTDFGDEFYEELSESDDDDYEGDTK